MEIIENIIHYINTNDLQSAHKLIQQHEGQMADNVNFNIAKAKYYFKTNKLDVAFTILEHAQKNGKNAAPYIFPYLEMLQSISDPAERQKYFNRLSAFATGAGISLAIGENEAEQNRFNRVEPVLLNFLDRENPSSILIISFRVNQFGKLIKSLFQYNHKTVQLGALDLGQNSSDPDPEVFSNSYNSDCLLNPERLNRYDCILITDLLENLEPGHATTLLNNILSAANKSVFCVLPVLYQNSNGDTLRPYHPAAFSHFDFSYSAPSAANDPLQYYVFYPPRGERPESISEPKIPVCLAGKKLKIAYILPHKNLTGGVKCLLEQMRQLQRRGHSVYAVYRNNPNEEENTTALPDWCNLNSKDISGQVILQANQPYQSALKDFDVIMVGFVNQLAEFSKPFSVPVVYWEQGYEGLYGDFGSLLESQSNTLKSLCSLYSAPVQYLAVSEQVSQILKSKYGIQADVLHNGIDLEFYRPDPSKQFRNKILLVGNPYLPFKGFAFAINLLNQVWKMGYRFEVDWACQIQPAVQNNLFPIHYFIMQPQAVLAKLYRKADIFLFTSLYESFPMPPFEAMASGLPVVAADCGGIHTYARAGENILLFDQGDIKSAAAAIIYLLKNDDARKQLSQNGRKTAEAFSFEKKASELETVFYTAIQKHKLCSVINLTFPEGNVQDSSFGKPEIQKMRNLLNFRDSGNTKAILQEALLYCRNLLYFKDSEYTCSFAKALRCLEEKADCRFEKPAQKIPKVIHYVWVGGKEKPGLAIKCINSWKKYLPDYKIVEWNETNFDFSTNKYARQAYQAKKVGFRIRLYSSLCLI